MAKLRESTELVVIHPSNTPPSQPLLGAPEVARMHRAAGLLGIGVHFVLTRRGEVQPGRPEAECGAHHEGHNHNSIGVCVVGGVDENGKPEANWTAEQRTALFELIEDLKQAYPGVSIKDLRPGSITTD